MALKKGVLAVVVLGAITLCLLFFTKAVVASFPLRGQLLATFHSLPDVGTHHRKLMMNPGSHEPPEDPDPGIRNTLENTMHIGHSSSHRTYYDFLHHHDLDYILHHALDYEIIDNLNIMADEETFLGHMQQGSLRQDHDNNFDVIMSNEEYEIGNVNIIPDEETFLGHMQEGHLHQDRDNDFDSIMSNKEFILDRMRDDPLYEPGEELMITNHHIQEHKYIKSHLSTYSRSLVAAS